MFPGHIIGVVRHLGGVNGGMRGTFAYLLLASLIGIGAAGATECAPGALGISRTIAVDPREHALLGSFQYSESLPLRDREVVLTFDDGPLPSYTHRILDTLASECVKATFFLVGRMARAYPAVVQRIHDDRHTIANHSQNHPFTFDRMTVEQASQEIEGGFESLQAVLGDPNAVAPFFRIPGLKRQSSVEQYLTARGYMTWSVDFHADDWTRISAQEVVRRAIVRMEARGRGILLLHDIQPVTALALPEILRELKARGFKIVHVVPAGPERPKTVTEPAQWVVRRAPEQKPWPRAVVATATATTTAPATVLDAPSPASFGIENLGARKIKVALAHTFTRHDAHDAPLALSMSWPHPAAYSLQDAAVLPVPGAHNFRYARLNPAANLAKPRVKKPTVATASPGGLLWLFTGNRPRPIGHQLTVARPPNGVQAR
jgi:peptidoglycan-N-acetylglucosamine deacetylase